MTTPHPNATRCFGARDPDESCTDNQTGILGHDNSLQTQQVANNFQETLVPSFTASTRWSRRITFPRRMQYKQHESLKRTRRQRAVREIVRHTCTGQPLCGALKRCRAPYIPNTYVNVLEKQRQQAHLANKEEDGMIAATYVCTYDRSCTVEQQE